MAKNCLLTLLMKERLKMEMGIINSKNLITMLMRYQDPKQLLADNSKTLPLA